MVLSAFMHRNTLFEICNRWLSNDLHPDDALQITKIIAFDGFAAWHTLLRLYDRINAVLHHPGRVTSYDIASKKDLKDYFGRVANPASVEIRALIDEYRRTPEFFFTGSPIVGRVGLDADNHLVSICRIKRIRRIAEKASRYAAAAVFERVVAAARRIDGAVGRNGLDPGQIPADVLLAAEKNVMEAIRRNGLRLPREPMTIKDVLGIKVIDSRMDEQRFEAAVEDHAIARIVGKKRHSGRYNAVHYVLELEVDPDDILRSLQAGQLDRSLSKRGLNHGNHLETFQAFMQSGDPTIQVDAILTSFPELVHSEIGRSMHEVRITRQRQESAVYGNIPTNIEFIIEYLFAVAMSPTTQVGEIPIKLWGRYLPDALSYNVRNLYQIKEFTLVSV